MMTETQLRVLYHLACGASIWHDTGYPTIMAYFDTYDRTNIRQQTFDFLLSEGLIALASPDHHFYGLTRKGETLVDTNDCATALCVLAKMQRGAKLFADRVRQHAWLEHEPRHDYDSVFPVTFETYLELLRGAYITSDGPVLGNTRIAHVRTAKQWSIKA